MVVEAGERGVSRCGGAGFGCSHPASAYTDRHPRHDDDTNLPFAFPAVSRKNVTASFDGVKLTSDGGVMLLAMADRRLGLARSCPAYSLSGVIQDPLVHSLAPASSPSRTTRMAMISIGYAAIGRSSWRAAGCRTLAWICVRGRPYGAWRIHLREVIRLSYVLVDLWMDSYAGSD